MPVRRRDITLQQPGLEDKSAMFMFSVTRGEGVDGVEEVRELVTWKKMLLHFP